MSHKPIPMIGKSFGRLAVISQAPNGAAGRRWNCKCLCGGATTASGADLRSGHTKSCGCWSKEVVANVKTKHGCTPKGGPLPPEYTTFHNMHRRCYDDTRKDFPRYGGRGIKVCQRWHDFASFFVDMGPRPSREHSLDRINSNGDYEPNNCRWATALQQQNNRSDNRIVTWRGKTRTLSEWSRAIGIEPQTLLKRLDRWAIDRAMTATLRADRRRDGKAGV